ncbi:MAG: hypothetical protein DMG31_13625 [Acidobacteria bacterium]|nr:MAG: hypothetical protein DMG31_13625 [Acidobacteriota bacterium]
MLGRVLLVDDHPAVRRTLRALLTEASLVMPQMNGLEAAYEIRQRAPSSKIILLSLHYSPEDGLALANALGANAFVHKSALANDLVPTIGRVLCSRLSARDRARARAVV